MIINGSGNTVSDVNVPRTVQNLNVVAVVNGFNVAVTVRNSHDGYVYFTFNGKQYRQDTVNGLTTFDLANVAPGAYSVHVYFVGSNSWENNSNILNFTVDKQNAIILAPNAAYSIVYGGTYTVKTNAFNQPVSFNINGKTYTVGSNADGVASIKLTKAMLMSAGAKNIVVSLDGSYFNSNSATAKVTVKKEKTKFKAKKTFKFKRSKKTKKVKVTLRDSRNKAVKKVKVTLKIKGKKSQRQKNIQG